MARDERGATPQCADFSAWYNEVVIRAELVDRGPVRGTMVIRPYGYQIWELLQADIDRRIKETGHLNAYFPLLIPESYLQREAEHVAGFAAAVRGGWALALHCGTPPCEDDIKAVTSATPRCIPAGGPAEEGQCIRCGLPSAYGQRSSSAGRTDLLPR